LPKRALSASATCPAGTAGIEAVVLLEFGTCDGDWAGGIEGTVKLLGPKISLRVAGTGEIRLVDGVAENSEFCARACGTAAKGATATTKSTSADSSRPCATAVADALFMTRLFSAEIEAISSQAHTLFVTVLTLW